MSPTDTAIRNAKPEGKARKKFDGRGLFLLVTAAGSKLWRFKYRIGGKEKLLSFGPYPDVSLKSAGAVRSCPSASGARHQSFLTRKAKKESGKDTFEAVAREWLAKQNLIWVPRHAETVHRRLERHVFPQLGNPPHPIYYSTRSLRSYSSH